jgi:hypothetical protein
MNIKTERVTKKMEKISLEMYLLMVNLNDYTFDNKLELITKYLFFDSPAKSPGSATRKVHGMLRRRINL